MTKNATVAEPLGPPTDQEPLVPVQREWYGWRVAQARMHDLEDVHWFQPPGAPRMLLHAYLHGANVVSGSLVDARDTEQLPERLLVCVLKSHTPAATYMTLADRADRSDFRRM